MSAARGYEPRRTETELSEEKYFFWRLEAAVGSQELLRRHDLPIRVGYRDVPFPGVAYMRY
jgi:hypothetical protein